MHTILASSVVANSASIAPLAPVVVPGSAAVLVLVDLVWFLVVVSPMFPLSWFSSIVLSSVNILVAAFGVCSSAPVSIHVLSAFVYVSCSVVLVASSVVVIAWAICCVSVISIRLILVTDQVLLY